MNRGKGVYYDHTLPYGINGMLIHKREKIYFRINEVSTNAISSSAEYDLFMVYTSQKFLGTQK